MQTCPCNLLKQIDWHSCNLGIVWQYEATALQLWLQRHSDSNAVTEMSVSKAYLSQQVWSYVAAIACSATVLPQATSIQVTAMQSAAHPTCPAWADTSVPKGHARFEDGKAATVGARVSVQAPMGGGLELIATA